MTIMHYSIEMVSVCLCLAVWLSVCGCGSVPVSL
eukprot:COSAG03_NODE_893_length_5468_cov_3.850251_4_plen_34_part_00